MASLPSHAQIVIIGGGIVGCSIAYHLTKAGIRRRAAGAEEVDQRNHVARGRPDPGGALRAKI